jgi:hypothetical protein
MNDTNHFNLRVSNAIEHEVVLESRYTDVTPVLVLAVSIEIPGPASGWFAIEGSRVSIASRNRRATAGSCRVRKAKHSN